MSAFRKIFRCENLEQIWEKIGQDYLNIAPTEVDYGGNKGLVLEFNICKNFKEMQLNRLPDHSPKKFYLPQLESLGEEQGPGEMPKDKHAIWGVRPCDLEGLSVLVDVFLEEDNIDPYFASRFANTLFIAFSCPKAEKGCFCESLGFNPLQTTKAPLIVYQRDQDYLIEVLNEEYEHYLVGCQASSVNELEKYLQEAQQKRQKQKFDIQLTTPLPFLELFEEPLWENLAQTCLGCGVCTYYCPTCYCFGFIWENEAGQITKWRTWDGCMYKNFVMHSSGHNPRDTQGKRLRQRIMHKFSYHPQRFKQLACVGCGRCTDNCPVKIDIKEIIAQLDNLQSSKGVLPNE